MDRSNTMGSGIRTEPFRRAQLEGIVDTGAILLMLPQNVVEQLGLETLRRAVVTYADERRDERPVAGPVAVEVCDRFMVTECVVGPPRSEPLVGRDRARRAGPDRRLRQPDVDGPRTPGYPSLKLKGRSTRTTMSDDERETHPDPGGRGRRVGRARRLERERVEAAGV